MSRQEYLDRIKQNITLWPIRTFIQSLLFFVPVWYAFETQFASAGTLNLIYAMTTFLTVVLELPTGAFADLFGRRNSSIFGYLLQGLSFIYISQARDASWLWIGYFVNAIAVSFISGADEALIYDSLKDLGREKEFTQLSSRNGLIFRVGLIISTLSGGFLYQLYSPLPYILVGSLLVLSGLITFKFVEPITDSEKFTVSNYLRQTKAGFFQLFQHREQTLFTLYYVIIGGTTFYFQNFLYLSFMTSLGFSTDIISYVLSALYVINGSLIYILSKYRNSVSKRLVLITFPLILTVGFIPAYFMHNYLGVISIFLIMLCNMARYNFLNHYANEEYESKYRATAISTLNMFTSLVFIIIALIASLIIDHLGAGFIMTSLGIVVLISSTLLGILYQKNLKNNQL